jgi:hypothetical protein
VVVKSFVTKVISTAIGGQAMADLWVFILAPLAGGAPAGILHRIGVTRAA